MENTYFDRAHLWGKIWSLAALGMLFCIPVSFGLYYNVWPAAAGVMKGLLAVLPMFWTIAIVEVISYAPMLGVGGMYISFVSGNISNLKLPCAIAAMENAKVRANTEEGEVITTIATASSAIATTVIIAAGVLVFSPIMPYLTNDDSVFAPAFQQVLPALFGALGASYFAKHFKLTLLPLLTGVIVLIFAPTMGAGTLIPITVIVSLISAQIMFKKNLV
jgi:hypothetical protein